MVFRWSVALAAVAACAACVAGPAAHDEAGVLTGQERLLPLEGGRNFRDMGGYTTVDGKTVRMGALYRSGTMHALTDADYELLAELGISDIYDFRATEERASEPTDWRAGEVEYFAWDYATETEEFRALFSQELTAERTRDMMMSMYPSIAKDHAHQYEAVFSGLVDADGATVINCSAGKDRTGVGSALILIALGVPREAVLADYALSEQLVDYRAEFEKSAGDDPEGPYAFLAQLPVEVMAPLMRSDPAYLEATLASLDAEYGSVMAFIQTELGVTDQDLETLRARYLE